MGLRNFAHLTLSLSLSLAVGCTSAAPRDVDNESTGNQPVDDQPVNKQPPKFDFDGALEIIVPPDENGHFPASLWVGCQSGPSFQVSDLDEIVPLTEGDPGGVEEAIQTFLSDGEGQFWPQEDWLILRETDDEILLVHYDADQFSFMDVSRTNDKWEWTGALGGGPCPLHYLTPDGLNEVDWRLDPQSPPDDSATTVTVLVTERTCVSGQGLGDRLLDPQVVLTEDELRIAFAARPPSGNFFTCQGTPETSVIVSLPEPLQDRKIIEGLALGIDLADFLP